jgi:hypothetical protein
MTYSIRLPQGFIRACLASVYILGFILTPYWLLHGSRTEIVFYLALTISVGLIWLFRATGSLQIEFSSRDVKLFLMLLAGVAVLNYRALNSVLPFRGDEVLHIERTMEVASRLPLLPSLVLIILLIAFILSGFKNPTWTIFIGVFMVIGIVFYFLGENLFEDMEKYPLFFLRYPFINYWFFALVPKLASPVTSPYHEVLYRIVPLLAMAGIAWVVQKKTGTTSLLGNIAWGLAVATIPLAFYYSSILYLEPPAVFLMTVVCLDINKLLHKSSKDISQTPSWYALILIGFIKETTVPFLLCFIAIRIAVQLQTWLRTSLQERSAKTLLNLLAGEAGIVFIVLAPAFLYLYFRTTLTTTRSFAPHLLNLYNLTNYRFVLLSFIEQFGPFLFFFIAGCLFLLINREFTVVLCYLALLLAIPAFHMMDYEVYAGYSRFNLFVLPTILAGATRFVIWAKKQKQYIGSTLVLVAIMINLLLSPVHWDGAKTPYWGSYRVDDSEHYYPYQDALVWLKDNAPNKRMLFSGLDFYYPFQFYWNKLDWKPKRDGMLSEGIRDETLAISSVLEKAESEGYSIVVYRAIDENPVLPEETGEFRVQVIKNSAHSLIIFYKR